MGLTLKLTRNVLNTFIGQKAQVLHDLHESVPYLYDNTIGDGPYNAWIDPILTDEWQMIGWNNVSEMTKFGMPGVFTHGSFDTWSPGYLMFVAALHHGISRLYETFGNGGADTVERELRPGLGVSVSYNRRSGHQLPWTNNTAISTSDFTPLTVPDPRGNGQTLTVYNISAAKQAARRNLIDVSENTSVWQGYDVSVHGRLANGLMFQGGTTTGRPSWSWT